MIYRNLQEHGDSRQKNIIMKTTNDVNENQRSIYLSCRWKLDALQDSNLFETPTYLEYWLILLRAKFKKNSSSGF